MPRKKLPNPACDDGLDRNIELTLKSAFKTMAERSQKSYDGVLGDLPAWVPDNFHAEFERARNRVLNNRYKPIEVRTFIAELINTSKAAFAKPNKPMYVSPSIPFKIRKEVNTLAHIWTAVQLGEVEGLAFLTDPTHAGQVAKGKKYGKHQSSIAQKPRGRVLGDGETIDQIIGSLALSGEYKEEGPITGLHAMDLSAMELWTHFNSELDRLNLNPQMIDHATDPKKDKIEYDFHDDRKSITFGRFANVVAKYRKEEKKKSR